MIESVDIKYNVFPSQSINLILEAAVSFFNLKYCSANYIINVCAIIKHIYVRKQIFIIKSEY